MSLFLDALSDAAAQMTETLTSVGQAFGAGWGRGLEALLDRPAALFYLAAFAALIVFMMGGLRGGPRRLSARPIPDHQRKVLPDDARRRARPELPRFRSGAPCRACQPDAWRQPASRRQALNGVMAKSVDFVICDVLTLDPVAAIEVDDRSHLLPERQQRDAFVNAVFLEIGLPLMRVKARRAYSVDELRVMCARAGLFTLPRMEGANS